MNVGTEEEIRVQLEHLVVRKNKEELPEGKKLIENPELHLTAMYLMQEMHRNIGPGDAGECEGTSGRDDGAL